MGFDLFVHNGLSETRLIALVVTILSVTHKADHTVLFVGLPVRESE